MTRSIEDYALLADGRCAALLGRDGSIDWLCWPRFDSDPCFASMLGCEGDGLWRIASAEPPRRASRCYQADTLVVETSFECEGGSVLAIDFMAVETTTPCLVRIIEGCEGSVAMHMRLLLRPYGDGNAVAHDRGGQTTSVMLQTGCGAMNLRSDAKLESRDECLIEAVFTVHAGERVAFSLSHGDTAVVDPASAIPALHDAQRHWRRWIERFDDSRTLWPQPVRRSLLTLKSLIYRPSGAMVAAPTTSLPELPGGCLNWDYRYCWLRDASFALEALLEAGFHEEARAWRDWLLRTLGASRSHIHIMYDVDGRRVPAERNIKSLAGWHGARPVRFGNAAATQYQPDVFGEALDCLYLTRRAGIRAAPEEAVLEERIVSWLLDHSERQGSGIWETRGEPRHYTTSRVMIWVALDRFIKHWCEDGPGAGDAMVQRAERLQRTLYEEVCTRGWDARRGAFIRSYGETGLDSSLLLMPLMGFMRVDDPRMSATIDAVRAELGEDGLIRRWRRGEGEAPEEGAFLACSCWMADCLYLRGDESDARAQFERVLAVANDVGLFAEEYDVRARTLAGNFPQALSHLAVVKTALLLSGSTKGHRSGG
ncbi:glycoside hydrolase family 15 protein [Paraburkholderia unamae]|uniref:GH15 family glucan-1,4-alpha-glucosidase n=1 Tax=Paraburkholderia unamae TaxID=219649 RepID=A0ABX5KB52_9BURK|nr:glycoside hydrolase family 15 protein [Paraburkholderia unamae]PVX61395.1 GH15 family glucan-1,4-alpha-glucosidase [Paraburkholderia unamae]RAR49323.1 GH15 family glucan-1,4-alpha-glucosidase [Paraburkholderia unamae]